MSETIQKLDEWLTSTKPKYDDQKYSMTINRDQIKALYDIIKDTPEMRIFRWLMAADSGESEVEFHGVGLSCLKQIIFQREEDFEYRDYPGTITPDGMEYGCADETRQHLFMDSRRGRHVCMIYFQLADTDEEDCLRHVSRDPIREPKPAIAAKIHSPGSKGFCEECAEIEVQTLRALGYNVHEDSN